MVVLIVVFNGGLWPSLIYGTIMVVHGVQFQAGTLDYLLNETENIFLIIQSQSLKKYIHRQAFNFGETTKKFPSNI